MTNDLYLLVLEQEDDDEWDDPENEGLACDGCDLRFWESDLRSCENCDLVLCDCCFGPTMDDLYAGWCRGCGG